MASDQPGGKAPTPKGAPERHSAQLRRLQPIPKPETFPRQLYAGDTLPHFTNEDGDDWLCGHCPALLLKSTRKEQIESAVFRCPKCGTYNVFP